MKKHFFERILAIIITFVVVILFWCILVLCLSMELSDGGYIAVYFVFFTVIMIILGLILDSIILYRKQERDKAKASLLVSFVFLLILYFFLSYFSLFVFLFIGYFES